MTPDLVPQVLEVVEFWKRLQKRHLFSTLYHTFGLSCAADWDAGARTDDVAVAILVGDLDLLAGDLDDDLVFVGGLRPGD